MNTLYDIKLQNKEIALSAEELLTMFNRNISKNAELLDYIGRTNLFEIIGKARNEGVHSRFIAELLSGSFFKGDSRESTLFHFMDLLLYRSAKEDKSDEINAKFKESILTRSVLFEKTASICELPVKEYQEKYGDSKKMGGDKGDRIDIYLRYKLLNFVAGRDTLEIFIENKVDSSEFDTQTFRYFDACDNGGRKRTFQFFVYLTPQPIRDMDNYSRLDSSSKPACPHYIHICYQDILDYVIEPLLADKGLDAVEKVRLKEYVGCLEQPAMPDADSQSQSNDLSIMAITAEERKMVHSFMEDAVNRRLVEKVIEAKIGKPLYSVHGWGTLFNATEALSGGLLGLINCLKEPLEILKKVADCKIVGNRDGANPFLIHSPETWRVSIDRPDRGVSQACYYLPYKNLYVYSGKVFGSLSSALAAAIKGYKEKYKKDNAQLVIEFITALTPKCGGVPLLSEVRQKGHEKTDIDGLYIRKDVPGNRLPSINDILGEDFSVEPIDNESYNELMRCDTQVYIDVPITQNGLPEEIEEIVEDVVGYEQVGTTPFFFRKDVVDDRILKLNQTKYFDFDIIEKCTDTSLLLDFFKSRRNLILSIYKILLEEEPYDMVYKEKMKIYHKLLKP